MLLADLEQVLASAVRSMDTGMFALSRIEESRRREDTNRTPVEAQIHTAARDVNPPMEPAARPQRRV